MQPVSEVRSSKYVLVAEDDAAIRDLLEQTLEQAGYSVSAAATGAEALLSMQQRLPDLLLLDLMMPDMTGWELLRRMSQIHELTRVPVLVVSAATASGISEAQELGAPVFLNKPFDLDDLLLEVERLTTRPTRQCAWCGQVASSTGDFDLHSGRSLSWATHGVCPACKRQQMDRIIRETAG